MADQIETAGNYLGSVAERTLGIHAWKEPKAEEEGAPMNSLVQILGPAMYRTCLKDIENIEELPTGLRSSAIFTGKFMTALFIDSALTVTAIMAMVVSGNPLSFVVYKLAANVTTQVGLDIVGAAAKRIRHLRPPGNNLAV